MSEMKVGDVIAFKCVDDRRPDRGEWYMSGTGEPSRAMNDSNPPRPILRRIEGATVCLPIERAHLDEHKASALGTGPYWTSGGYALESHYRAEHAREQAAKRAKWELQMESFGGCVMWGVCKDDKLDSLWPDGTVGICGAKNRADALNALDERGEGFPNGA